MKKYLKIIMSIIIFLSLYSCPSVYTTVVYNPIYTSWEEIRSSSSTEFIDAKSITDPGKIYVWESYIFIVEKNKGIHIIDNSSPADPHSLGFQEVPGCGDISVLQKDGIVHLYADSFTDLLIFEFTQSNSTIQLINRIQDTFPYDASRLFEDENPNIYFEGLDVSKGIVSDFTIETITEYGYGAVIEEDGSNGSTGTAGSMSRFALYEDVAAEMWYLYAVDNRELVTLILDDPANPARINRTNIGWNIDTIFSYDSKLYIGSDFGMYIYSLENPEQVIELSTFLHITARDPVFIGEVGLDSTPTAFITLREDEYGLGDNILIAADVTNPNHPDLVLEIPMWNPHGVTFFNDRLIVCEGEAGLKIFDVSELYNSDLPDNDRIKLIKAFDNGINTFDIINIEGIIFVIGDDGFYEYSYSEVDGVPVLTLLSAIEAF